MQSPSFRLEIHFDIYANPVNLKQRLSRGPNRSQLNQTKLWPDSAPGRMWSTVTLDTYHLLYVITNDKTKSEKIPKMLAITPESDHLKFCDDFFSGRHQATAEVDHECSYPRMKRLNFTR